MDAIHPNYVKKNMGQSTNLPIHYIYIIYTASLRIFECNRAKPLYDDSTRLQKP